MQRVLTGGRLFFHLLQDISERKPAAPELPGKLINDRRFGLESTPEGLVARINLQLFILGPALSLVAQIGSDRIFDLVEQTAGPYFAEGVYLVSIGLRADFKACGKAVQSNGDFGGRKTSQKKVTDQITRIAAVADHFREQSGGQFILILGLSRFIFTIDDPHVFPIAVVETASTIRFLQGAVARVGIEGVRLARFHVEEDVVMRGDVLVFRVHSEVILPNDVVELFQLGISERLQYGKEVGVARDDVNAATRFEDTLSLPDPITAELIIFLCRNLDIAIDDEILLAVVVLMQLIAADAIGRIGDDQVD